MSLLAAMDAHDMASEAWRRGRDDDPERGLLDAVTATRADVRRARRHIAILGPEAVQASVLEITEQLNQLSLGSQPAWSSGHPAAEALATAEDGFLKKAEVVIVGDPKVKRCWRLPGHKKD
ncbi:hypothetical protein ACFZAM_02975 [Streptomyces sp. NPDC008079]|uniref:hypothetical protein n=1 Tax=Streptomyces sp. NPDC008079 TaxID=3364806 RepID=UPI0036EADEAD